MRLLVGLIVTVAVFIFVGVVGWVEFYPINDSVLLGTIAAAGVYWAVALVSTLVAGILGAFIGAIIGALTGSISGGGELTTAVAGCGAVVFMVGAAFAADIYVLLNLHSYVEWFPVIATGVAIFISVSSTIMGLLFNHNTKEK
jgi:hypothetical protein